MNAVRSFVLILTGMVVAVFANSPVLAQSDEDEPPPAAEAPATEEDDDDNRDPLIRDGVFRPSEEIEADSEISFPADI